MTRPDKDEALERAERTARAERRADSGATINLRALRRPPRDLSRTAVTRSPRRNRA